MPLGSRSAQASPSSPTRCAGRHLLGAAALGGIGFTVSLFITGLSFDNAALVADAKIGILAASALATALGALLLRWENPDL